MKSDINMIKQLKQICLKISEKGKYAYSTGLKASDGVEVCVFIIVASYEQVSRSYVH